MKPNDGLRCSVIAIDKFLTKYTNYIVNTSKATSNEKERPRKTTSRRHKLLHILQII